MREPSKKRGMTKTRCHLTKGAPMAQRNRIRLCMGIASLLLLSIEILIGMFAHGFVRNSLGDVLVVMLLYTLFRTVSPEKPRAGWLLPTGLLLFACCVEYLQLWGFCDRFHITNRLLRIIIGTGFSFSDLLCYAAGSLPCFLAELHLRRILSGGLSASKATPPQTPQDS